MSGFLAYIFGPFLPLTGVSHSVGNSVQQFVDEGVSDRFFGVAQGVSGDFYVVFIFRMAFAAPSFAAASEGASCANEFYRWAYGT